jgi:hypothetical protein
VAQAFVVGNDKECFCLKLCRDVWRTTGEFIAREQGKWRALAHELDI